MRTKYLFVLFAVPALLLPCAAHAQCSDFYCETFAVYNPGSGTITGYSLYDDYGISWGWWLEVQSYVSDPTEYYNPVGQSWGYDYVEVDFSYTPTMNGGYTAWGYNYYNEEVWWPYDGASFYDVYVGGPAGQQITGCPSPSWVLGGNYVQILGSGFSQSTPSLSWSGNGGVDFLNGDSWVQVYSDVEIMVYADLLPLSTQGTLALTAGTAACFMAVSPLQAPPGPPPTLRITLTRGGADVTGTTQSVLVGQWVDLTAVVSNATGVPTFAWSQPRGNTAINWIDNADTSQQALVPIQASELSSSEIYFAWTDTSGSGQPLQVTATLPGLSPLQATVTYNISLPSVTVEPVQEQTPYVGPSCGGYDYPAICLYEPASGTPGIVFNAIGCSTAGNSLCEWEQVIDYANNVTTPTSGQACVLAVQSALDGGSPLRGGPFASDSPSQGLPAGVQEQTISEDFSTYLLFKYNASSMQDDGVWVPLFRVDWGWGATPTAAPIGS